MDTRNEARRRIALAEHRLDVAAGEQVLMGRHFTRQPDRGDYGETRFVTVGFLGQRFVVVVWTPRYGGRRTVFMRHGHDREQARFQSCMD